MVGFFNFSYKPKSDIIKKKVPISNLLIFKQYIKSFPFKTVAPPVDFNILVI